MAQNIERILLLFRRELADCRELYKDCHGASLVEYHQEELKIAQKYLDSYPVLNRDFYCRNGLPIQIATFARKMLE